VVAATAAEAGAISAEAVTVSVTEVTISWPHNCSLTYLRDSRARIDIVPGDARFSIERELANGNPQSFDVLVLDAFSGDAIPVHLLTIEAFEVYLRELTPDGILAIRVTNRYLDLQPIIQVIANHFGLTSGRVHSRAVHWSNPATGYCWRAQFSPRPTRIHRPATVVGLTAESPALDRRLQQSVSDSEVIHLTET